MESYLVVDEVEITRFTKVDSARRSNHPSTDVH